MQRSSAPASSLVFLAVLIVSLLSSSSVAVVPTCRVLSEDAAMQLLVVSHPLLFASPPSLDVNVSSSSKACIMCEDALCSCLSASSLQSLVPIDAIGGLAWALGTSGSNVTLPPALLQCSVGRNETAPLPVLETIARAFMSQPSSCGLEESSDNVLVDQQRDSLKCLAEFIRCKDSAAEAFLKSADASAITASQAVGQPLSNENWCAQWAVSQTESAVDVEFSASTVALEARVAACSAVLCPLLTTLTMNITEAVATQLHIDLSTTSSAAVSASCDSAGILAFCTSLVANTTIGGLNTTTSSSSGVGTGSSGSNDPVVVFNATLSINGTSWDAVLANASAKASLKVSLENDLALFLRVPVANIKVLALSLGSLVVEYVVQETASQPISVADVNIRLNEMRDSSNASWLASTVSSYVAETGLHNESFSVLASSFTIEVTPQPTSPPAPGPSIESNTVGSTSQSSSGGNENQTAAMCSGAQLSAFAATVSVDPATGERTLFKLSFVPAVVWGSELLSASAASLNPFNASLNETATAPLMLLMSLTLKEEYLEGNTHSVLLNDNAVLASVVAPSAWSSSFQDDIVRTRGFMSEVLPILLLNVSTTFVPFGESAVAIVFPPAVASSGMYLHRDEVVSLRVHKMSSQPPQNPQQKLGEILNASTTIAFLPTVQCNARVSDLVSSELTRGLFDPMQLQASLTLLASNENNDGQKLLDLAEAALSWFGVPLVGCGVLLASFFSPGSAAVASALRDAQCLAVIVLRQSCLATANSFHSSDDLRKELMLLTAPFGIWSTEAGLLGNLCAPFVIAALQFILCSLVSWALPINAGDEMERIYASPPASPLLSGPITSRSRSADGAEKSKQPSYLTKISRAMVKLSFPSVAISVAFLASPGIVLTTVFLLANSENHTAQLIDNSDVINGSWRHSLRMSLSALGILNLVVLAAGIVYVNVRIHLNQQLDDEETANTTKDDSGDGLAKSTRSTGEWLLPTAGEREEPRSGWDTAAPNTQRKPLKVQLREFAARVKLAPIPATFMRYSETEAMRNTHGLLRSLLLPVGSWVPVIHRSRLGAFYAGIVSEHRLGYTLYTFVSYIVITIVLLVPASTWANTIDACTARLLVVMVLFLQEAFCVLAAWAWRIGVSNVFDGLSRMLFGGILACDVSSLSYVESKGLVAERYLVALSIALLFLRVLVETTISIVDAALWVPLNDDEALVRQRVQQKQNEKAVSKQRKREKRMSERRRLEGLDYLLVGGQTDGVSTGAAGHGDGSLFPWGRGTGGVDRRRPVGYDPSQQHHHHHHHHHQQQQQHHDDVSRTGAKGVGGLFQIPTTSHHNSQQHHFTHHQQHQHHHDSYQHGYDGGYPYPPPVRGTSEELEPRQVPHYPPSHLPHHHHHHHHHGDYHHHPHSFAGRDVQKTLEHPPPDARTRREARELLDALLLEDDDGGDAAEYHDDGHHPPIITASMVDPHHQSSSSSHHQQQQHGGGAASYADYHHHQQHHHHHQDRHHHDHHHHSFGHVHAHHHQQHHGNLHAPPGSYRGRGGGAAAVGMMTPHRTWEELAAAETSSHCGYRGGHHHADSPTRPRRYEHPPQVPPPRRSSPELPQYHDRHAYPKGCQHDDDERRHRHEREGQQHDMQKATSRSEVTRGARERPYTALAAERRCANSISGRTKRREQRLLRDPPLLPGDVDEGEAEEMMAMVAPPHHHHDYRQW